MKVILIALVFYLTTVLSNGDVVKDKRDAEDHEDDEHLSLTDKQSEDSEPGSLATRMVGMYPLNNPRVIPRQMKHTPDEEQPTVIQQKHALTDDVVVSRIKKRAPAAMPYELRLVRSTRTFKDALPNRLLRRAAISKNSDGVDLINLLNESSTSIKSVGWFLEENFTFKQPKVKTNPPVTDVVKHQKLDTDSQNLTSQSLPAVDPATGLASSSSAPNLDTKLKATPEEMKLFEEIQNWINNEADFYGRTDKIVKTSTMYLETLIRRPNCQENGVLWIVDCKNYPLWPLRYLLSPYFLRDLLNVLMVPSFKVRSITILNSPRVSIGVWTLIKPFIQAKIHGRVNFYGSEWAEMFNYIPQQLIPDEYGGSAGSIDTHADAFYREVLSMSDYFIDDDRYGYQSI
ncbi:hypothetical protein CHUAL_001122 [Chamberlinius hualienensis]